jgi:hypothetical protein
LHLLAIGFLLYPAFALGTRLGAWYKLARKASESELALRQLFEQTSTAADHAQALSLEKEQFWRQIHTFEQIFVQVFK